MVLEERAIQPHQEKIDETLNNLAALDLKALRLHVVAPFETARSAAIWRAGGRDRLTPFCG
jgi:hypothetical protein